MTASSPGEAVRRCGVLGSPIAHSLSPVLHRAAYGHLGVEWQYDAYDVREDALAGFIDTLDADWRGLSLTMPLKRAVLPLLDEVDSSAQLVEAANTVLLEPGGRRVGANTDIGGMVAALRERGISSVRSALVLGGGATATSALAALRQLGGPDLEVTVLVRHLNRADELRGAAGRMGLSPHIRLIGELGLLDPVDVVVSTVPAAAAAQVAEAVVERAGAVFDVIYHPWPTPLAQAAQARGATVLGGLDLLVHQAVLQVQMMTGMSTDGLLPAMRAAGEAELTARIDHSVSG